MPSDPQILEKDDFDCEMLLKQHPPVLRHPHKRMVFDQCLEAGYQPTGILIYSRWAPQDLPDTGANHPCQTATHPGFYDYAIEGDGVWHVNFADPHLFVAYGSGLLAQDEIQVLEHPLLGCLREALIADHRIASTETNSGPTPVLVQNVERVCQIDTTPSDTSPKGLYGNRFQNASAAQVRNAIRILPKTTRTNLIAIAAPVGHGRYLRSQIDWILNTAYCGFRAAVLSAPLRPVQIHTGFWGCGAFGGNRPLMTLLQLLAGRLAQVDQIVFHLGSLAEQVPFDEGQKLLQQFTRDDPSVQQVIERIVQHGFSWGTSDGN